jgi:lipopolysaccharide export system protein LptA
MLTLTPIRIFMKASQMPIALSVLCLLWLGMPPMAEAFAQGKSGGIKANLINVAADHQTYDGAKSKSFLNGNVVVTYKDIQIKSKQATMDIDAGGSPILASFFPRPKAKRTDAATKAIDTLEADTIKIYMQENAISAEGHTYTYVTTVASDPFAIRADVQQFDNNTKNVVAKGSVQVNYQKTIATSPKALLQVGSNGKAERVVFSGGTKIVQENSTIESEKVTIMVGSGNMIAEQNVKTVVDVKNQGVTNQGVPNQNLKDPNTSKSTKVHIISDYQQYDKASEKVLASGNVKIIYENYIATGPKATFTLKDGSVDQIILTGRSTIIEDERKITADRIIITTNPKHFDAVGNVKTQFKTKGEDQPSAPAKPVSGKTTGKLSGKKGATAGKPASKPSSNIGKPDPDLLDDTAP